MSQLSYIPVPYFQFVPNATDYDLTNFSYKAVPNKKIHRHCPFIVINADYINEPHMNVAIAAVEEEPAPAPSSDATGSDKASSANNSGDKDPDSADPTANSEANTAKNGSDQKSEPKELSAKEKDRLDFLAKQKADPANKVTQPQPEIEDSSTADEDSFQAESHRNSHTKTDSSATSDESSSEAPSNSEDTQNNVEETKAVEQTKAKVEATSVAAAATTDPSQSDSNVQSVDNEQSIKPATETQHKVDEEQKVQAKHQDEQVDEDEQQDEQAEEDDDEELTEEEKAKKEKEAKLESYKQFLAEQKSKVDIDYPGIRVDIEANALPSRMYFIMNALSAIIASYGLVINSAAVVIGAMLVAMMLGPISGAALAIIDYRIPFLRKSLFTVLAGAAMVVLIGFIVGFIHQDTPLTNEILSRTQPTSMDLMIALAGGTAGAYAMISPHLSVAVVGVAVATALVPPLAASGILFAYGESTLGLGALLLAVTNIIAIQFTNALVLWFAGFRRLIDDDYKTSPMMAFFRRNTVPLLLLVGIGAYLTYNFNTITKKQKFENEVKESLTDYFIDKGNALANTQFAENKDYQNVRAVIRGETRPSTSDAQHLEQQINHRIEEEYPKYKPVRLQLRYIPVIVIESSPYRKDEIDQTDAAILANE